MTSNADAQVAVTDVTNRAQTLTIDDSVKPAPKEKNGNGDGAIQRHGSLFGGHRHHRRRRASRTKKGDDGPEEGSPAADGATSPVLQSHSADAVKPKESADDLKKRNVHYFKMRRRKSMLKKRAKLEQKIESTAAEAARAAKENMASSPAVTEDAAETEKEAEGKGI